MRFPYGGGNRGIITEGILHTNMNLILILRIPEKKVTQKLGIYGIPVLSHFHFPFRFAECYMANSVTEGIENGSHILKRFCFYTIIQTKLNEKSLP